MNDATSSFAYLAGLFGIITVGAAVPILPSGAPLSAGAALAAKDGALTIALVFVIGAAAAYVGDLLTYIALLFTVRQTSSAHGRLGRWVNKERQSKAAQRVERAFEKRPMRTMMVSRLVPGGRTPVLIVVALDEYRLCQVRRCRHNRRCQLVRVLHGQRAGRSRAVHQRMGSRHRKSGACLAYQRVRRPLDAPAGTSSRPGLD